MTSLSSLLIAVDFPSHPNFEDHLRELYREQINKHITHSHSNDNAFQDSGFDLFNPLHTKVYSQFDNDHPPQVSLNHGIKIASFSLDGMTAHPVYLYPRSSLSKTPVRMANSVGIIDSGYRGNIIAKVDIHPHLFHPSVYTFDDQDVSTNTRTFTGNNNETFLLEKDKRYFQLCSHNLLPFHKIELVDKNDPRLGTQSTLRGSGGFGSTG